MRSNETTWRPARVYTTFGSGGEKAGLRLLCFHLDYSIGFITRSDMVLQWIPVQQNVVSSSRAMSSIPRL
jgi:hypothetical protein